MSKNNFEIFNLDPFSELNFKFQTLKNKILAFGDTLKKFDKIWDEHGNGGIIKHSTKQKCIFLNL